MHITSVTIPYTVTVIGEYAFADCKELETVIIGKGVEVISYGAFDSCQKLTNIYYEGTEEEWNQIDIGASNHCLYDLTIHFNYSAE